MIWQSEKVPYKLVTGIFIMLYKKGSRKHFGNHRSIYLHHAYKLLSAVIARHIYFIFTRADILPDSQVVLDQQETDIKMFVFLSGQ